MATINLSTGNITGCVEGSKTWYHEKGHLAFNQTDFGAKIDYYQYFFMMIAVFFGSLSIIINNYFLHIFTFLNALGMIVSYAYQELWAWAWAVKEWKKVNS